MHIFSVRTLMLVGIEKQLRFATMHRLSYYPSRGCTLWYIHTPLTRKAIAQFSPEDSYFRGGALAAYGRNEEQTGDQHDMPASAL